MIDDEELMRLRAGALHRKAVVLGEIAALCRRTGAWDLNVLINAGSSEAVALALRLLEEVERGA